jgi:hypothetical protein
MKRKIFILWAVLHLCYVIAVNIVSSHFAYCDFYRKKHNAVIEAFSKVLFCEPLLYYGKYTGGETGYGFFGVNVRSNGMFMAECGGKKLATEFHSFETSLRFFSLSSALTDNLLSREDTAQGAKLLGDYNELAIKNIAVKLYNDNHCSDSVIDVSYNLLEFPSLKEYRAGLARDYYLTEIRTFQFALKNDKETGK